MSTALAVVVNVVGEPAAHLKDAGQVIVRPPVASCVINQLMVCPSEGLLSVGAVVTFAVNVVVNTLDSEQLTVIAVALNVTATDGVWALPEMPRSPYNVILTSFDPPV